MKEILKAAAIIVLLALLSIFVFYPFGKKLNYKFAYENMVKQTVKEMVKKEALK